MATKSYVQAQFDKLGLSEEWKSKLVIHGGTSGQTHWMNITNEQVEQIKQILLQRARDEQ